VLLDQLRAHAAARPRFGYRRLHLLLRREGVVVNHKRIYRLYRLEGLSVRTKRRKRMVAAPRTVLPAATRPNERWSMDFVSDVTESGRRFRVFAVVDDFSRRCVALVADTSFSGTRVSRILEEVGSVHRLPEMVVRDNGPESPARRSISGRTSGRSSFTSFDRASRWRTRTSRASTGSSATSA